MEGQLGELKSCCGFKGEAAAGPGGDAVDEACGGGADGRGEPVTEGLTTVFMAEGAGEKVVGNPVGAESGRPAAGAGLGKEGAGG